MAAIEVNTESVEGVFTSFYAVPEFQREYVWKKRHVTKLMRDLRHAYENNREGEKYFLGSVVFYEGEEKVRYLVDGQQRIVTLFILVAAIRDRLKALDPMANVDVPEKAIKDSTAVRRTGTVTKFRVVLQYPELSDTLEAIGYGKGPDMQIPRGDSGLRNLISAYKLLEGDLAEFFGEDGSDLGEFFAFVWNDVQLITIQTADIRSAFTIFETINDRGVGLNAMDLLKNLLFRETRKGDRARLTSIWKEILSVLRAGGETKPIRFLRYYLVANFTFDKMPTAAALFDWILDKDHAAQLGYGTNPVGFANDMLKAAKAYANFLKGRNVGGSENKYLRRIEFQKTGVKQHLCLLLAAQGANKAAFEKLTEAIERLVFLYAITSTQWNQLESSLPLWSEKLRRVKAESDMTKFIAEDLDSAVAAKVPEFCDRLKNLERVPRRLQMYLLASLSQYLAEQLGRGSGFEAHFKERLSIEHIYPQNPGEQAAKDFGPTQESRFYTYQLGNLCLLYLTDNSSAQNFTFADKIDWYRKENFPVTKSLVDDFGGGNNTKRNDVVGRFDLKPYDEWNPANLAHRHAVLLKIASELWQVDVSGCLPR